MSGKSNKHISNVKLGLSVIRISERSLEKNHPQDEDTSKYDWVSQIHWVPVAQWPWDGGSTFVPRTISRQEKPQSLDRWYRIGEQKSPHSVPTKFSPYPGICILDPGGSHYVYPLYPSLCTFKSIETSYTIHYTTLSVKVSVDPPFRTQFKLYF